MRRERRARRGEMKPAVDEMFPEGAGPYVDLDEVRREAAGRAAGREGGGPPALLFPDESHTRTRGRTPGTVGPAKQGARGACSQTGAPRGRGARGPVPWAWRSGRIAFT